MLSYHLIARNSHPLYISNTHIAYAFSGLLLIGVTISTLSLLQQTWKRRLSWGLLSVSLSLIGTVHLYNVYYGNAPSYSHENFTLISSNLYPYETPEHFHIKTAFYLVYARHHF